jgi:hypothetical protein
MKARMLIYFKGSWKCISIVVRCGEKKSAQHLRTIDLLFSNENEALAWFLGLNYLVSECKKKLLDSTSASSFEAKRDEAINKKLSNYKWAKLRLQVQERAMRQGKSVSASIEETLNKRRS